MSLLFPSLALVVINQADPAKRGAALGAFASFWDVGIAVGAPAAGPIASLSGDTAVYYVMAACPVASAVMSAPVGRILTAGRVQLSRADQRIRPPA